MYRTPPAAERHAELGGKAISNTEQPPLSSASAIGIGAAVVIFLVAFGSLFATAWPIVTAAARVGSGLMLIAPLSHLMSVNGIAAILRALIGLGVGVDYALFIATRYRRGLQSGQDPQRSAVQALNTSGRAVLFAAARWASPCSVSRSACGPARRPAGCGAVGGSAPAGRARRTARVAA